MNVAAHSSQIILLFDKDTQHLIAFINWGEAAGLLHQGHHPTAR